MDGAARSLDLAASRLVPRVAVAGRALLLIAVAAVDRLVAPRLEGNFRLHAAGRANSREHLARAAAVAAPTGVSAAGVATIAVAIRGTLRLTSSTAARAALRLREPALLIVRLLAGSKGKRLAAIAAHNRAVAHSAEALCVDRFDAIRKKET